MTGTDVLLVVGCTIAGLYVLRFVLALILAVLWAVLSRW